uniref:Uncharacterized protein n=1 Tax=Panagrolaimus sp. JU765 TaxID=591449 RepID=A0AC34QQ67_9BILA
MNPEHQKFIDQIKESIKHAPERTKEQFLDVKDTSVGDSTPEEQQHDKSHIGPEDIDRPMQMTDEPDIAFDEGSGFIDE